MDALEELRELSSLRKGPPCQVGTVRLDGEDAAALEVGLVDQTITAKAIAAFLAKRGTKIGYWTIARHRRGDCGCGK